VSYETLAVLIVLAIPFAVLGLLVAVVGWARDAIARERRIATVGIACTAIAAANLLVARSCGDDVNRPIITLVTSSGACFRTGLLSLEVVLLLAVATSTAVRLADVRR
jgi:hypothetical protein